MMEEKDGLADKVAGYSLTAIAAASTLLLGAYEGAMNMIGGIGERAKKYWYDKNSIPYNTITEFDGNNPRHIRAR